MASCGECNEIVTAIPDSIACRNRGCNIVYHARCAGFSRSKLSIITESASLRWFCNACCEATQSPPVIATVDVSTQLIAIHDSITKLADAIVKPPMWPTVLSSAKSSKRRRVIDSDESLESNVPPTPRSGDIVIGSAESNEVLQVVEPRKNLVASMLHPSTESEQLEVFLKEKLNVSADSSEIRIHKLVPAGTDLAKLDYVSFKVSVPGHRFDEFMSPTIWPKGVRVREFEFRPRKSRSVAVFLPAPKAAADVVSAQGDHMEEQ